MSDSRSCALSTVPQHDGRGCFSLAFDHAWQDAQKICLSCQSPGWRIPVRKMSQDKTLQTLYISEATLETLWLPQGGGQVESAPTESHFCHQDWTEVKWWNGKIKTILTTTTKIETSSYPTLLLAKNWVEHFINLSSLLPPWVDH